MKLMRTIPLMLLLVLMMSYNILLAATTQCSPEKIETSMEEMPAAESMIDVENVEQSSQILDANENAEILKRYQSIMDRVMSSKKNRLFSEKVETGGLPIVKWLEQGKKRLLELAKKYPESRHVSEGLGLLDKELYERTQDRKYAKKAADTFIRAGETRDKIRVGRAATVFTRTLKLRYPISVRRLFYNSYAQLSG